MEIMLARRRGFCYGVKRAVRMAQECAASGKKAFTLGPIIHNPQLVERLAARGVGVIDDLAAASAGDTVVIRSHGAGPAVYEAGRARDLVLADATCPHVQKVQRAAHRLAREGYQVVVIGEKEHPEVQSILAWAGDAARVAATEADARELPFIDKLGVVVQTTFTVQSFQRIVAVLAAKMNEMKVERTICSATEERQQAAMELAGAVDLMLVIGGKNSANTTHLAELCRKKCRARHVETAAELEREWFEGVAAVGITAGASTPEWLIEEVRKKVETMDEAMHEMAEEMVELKAGDLVRGTVVGVRRDEVFVSVGGYKEEGIIPLAELAYPTPETAADVVQEDDVLTVYVMAAGGEAGLKLSKVRADKILAWETLGEALEKQQNVEGKVTEVVKGGLVAAVLGLRGFIPASQVALRFVEDLQPYVGQTLLLRPIECQKSKQRVVLSRRIVLEEERREKEAALLATLQVNQIVKGTVKRLTSYGAFIDIGGLDGLAHISDLSWERVKSPAEVVQVGDEVEAMVVKLDAAAKRVGLSLKNVRRDPWLDKADLFSPGMIVQGKVVKLAQFGAFVELMPGLEGLVKLSDLTEKRIGKAEEAVKEGQIVKAKIKVLDKKTKRIALSVVEAEHDAERADFNAYMGQQAETAPTLGDQFAHLFKKFED